MATSAWGLAESTPIVGNMIDAYSAGAETLLAGCDYLAGDDKAVDEDLAEAKEDALSAIPGYDTFQRGDEETYHRNTVGGANRAYYDMLQGR